MGQGLQLFRVVIVRSNALSSVMVQRRARASRPRSHVPALSATARKKKIPKVYRRAKGKERTKSVDIQFNAAPPRCATYGAKST